MALRHSLGNLSEALLSIVRTRLEIFSIELAEQKSRLVLVLGMAFAALLFLTLALLVFSIAVALYFWPTEARYTALGVLALLYALLGSGFLWWVRRALLHGPAPFEITLQELQRDFGMVDRLRRDGSPLLDERHAGDES